MKETTDRIRSTWLKNERPIWVREPRDRSCARDLTVFLDGEFYRDRVGALEVIDALQGQVADSWYVFVSMESAEARWIECPCHPPFARFVAEELLPWLERKHPEMRATRRRVLAGLSYTGLAAAFIAKEYPGMFQKVVSQSGSFWSNDGWLTDQFSTAAVRLPTEFYLDVGTREIQENVEHREGVVQVMSQIEGVRRFRDVLLRLGHLVKYAEFDGGHEFGGWRKALPDALKWALPPEPERATPRRPATAG